MSRLELLLNLPNDVRWPLLFAAALPLLVYILVPATSRRLSGRLALRFAQWSATLLAFGFSIVVAVATVEVLATGLADRTARYQPPTLALARALSAIPDVLHDSARVSPRLEIAVASENNALWSALIPAGAGPVTLPHTDALPLADVPLIVAATRRAAASSAAVLVRRRGRLELLSLAAVRRDDGTPVGTAILAVDTRSVTGTAIRTAWLLIGLASLLLVASVALMRRLIQLSVSVRVADLIARLQGVAPMSAPTLKPPHQDEFQQLRSEVDLLVDKNVRLQRENDLQYQMMVERMPDAVVVCRREGIELANAAAVRLLGAASADALVGSGFWTRISGEPDALDSGMHQHRTLRREDGAIRQVEISEAVLSDVPDGATEIVVRDITSSVQAEMALARSEVLYRTLFDSAPIGISVINEQLQILAANPALLRLFSVTRREEVIGQPLASVIALPKSARDALRHGLTEGGARRFNVEFTPVDGALRYATVTIQPLAAVDSIAQFELLWLDLTAQRVLEAQVQHTQKLEAVGQLSSGIAHDFNNLLTIIRANASLLAALRGRVPELDAIEDASVRGAALTRKLLIFSRKQELSPNPWSVRVLLDELLGVLRRLLPASIELRAPDVVPDVALMVDRIAFEQVMINLVTNARDAMPGGGVLAIGVQVVAPELCVAQGTQSMVRFTVSDCGTGMSDDVKARVFEPFFTTKPPEKGTGLGLSIVYGLVTQMGGTVTITDAAGGGTCVIVSLPVSRAAIDVTTPIPLDSASSGVGSVLLVEDDDAVRWSTGKLIESLGYTVATAEHGVAAMALLEAGPVPDLIVSDVMMPAMGGVELVERIRARGWTMPVLLVSGYSTESLTAIADRDPTVGILAKPWSLLDLSREIRDRLDVRAADRK